MRIIEQVRNNPCSCKLIVCMFHLHTPVGASAMSDDDVLLLVGEREEAVVAAEEGSTVAGVLKAR